VAVVTLGECLDEALAKFAEARQRGCPNDHQIQRHSPNRHRMHTAARDNVIGDQSGE